MTKRPNPKAVFETRPAPIRYKGFSAPAEVTAWWDENGEAILEGESLAERDGRYAALRDLIEDLSSPASLRMFRERLGLTSEEASELIDPATDAFRRFEDDTDAVSKPALNLLRLLAKRPELIKELSLDEDVAARSHHAKGKSNREFRLIKTRGLGSAPMIRVAARGLKTHIHVLPAKSGPRAYRVMSQRMGIRKEGRVLYRRGPLDDLPHEELARRAIASVGLDPDHASWADIWQASEGE